MSEFRYGDNRTIHGTDHVDVETDEKGNVVSVWFRCMMLPFEQTKVKQHRAMDMLSAYKRRPWSILAVVFDKPEGE
jgi:hypothetical protein